MNNNFIIDSVTYSNPSFYSANSGNLGSSTFPWISSYITNSYISNLYAANGTSISLRNSIYPSSNNTYNLGSTSSRFSYVYAYFLGSSTYKLSNVFTTSIGTSSYPTDNAYITNINGTAVSSFLTSV